MDALDALSTERPTLSTRLWRDRTARTARADTWRSPAEVGRLVAQLPILVRGGWSPPVPLGPTDAALRLQAAVWELAARRRVLVGATATAVEVTAKLRACGAIVPPAADAVALLEPLLVEGSPADDLEVSRVVARLIAYVELRARFG